MFFVIFYIAKLWVLADVIANYFCQMLIHLTKDVIGWNVMRTILEKHQEHLERGTRSI